MAALSHLVVPVGDVELAVSVAGDGGETVVLVHGSGGNRATWWPVVPLLAESVTVVSLDVRGSGRSGGSLEDPRVAAADLEAVRATLGIARWHVIGHSLGGWHAAHHAAAYPSSSASLHVVSSIGGVLVPAAREFLGRFAEMAAKWSTASEVGVSTSFSEGYAEAHRGEVYLHQMLRELNPPATGAGVPAEVAPSSLAGVPSWFVTGSEDQFAPPSVVAAIAGDAPGASYVEMAGAGHMCFAEQPEAFVDLVLTNIRSAPARS